MSGFPNARKLADTIEAYSRYHIIIMSAESQKAYKDAEIWKRQSACPERCSQARVGTASAERSEDGEVYSTSACSGSSTRMLALSSPADSKSITSACSGSSARKTSLKQYLVPKPQFSGRDNKNKTLTQAQLPRGCGLRIRLCPEDT